jgi:Holliday junction DNA helicase RuvA
MFEYINGKLQTVTPTYAVIDAGGVGYFINISLNTYSVLEKASDYKLYIHHVVREDAELLFGFADESEREIFRLLISVSGIGANTARVMLSSLKPGEIKNALRNEDVNVLKAIKGIGAKTAQRVIIDLKDKIDKTQTEGTEYTVLSDTTPNEAISALIMLGFVKNKVEKAVKNIYAKEKDLSVEELVKKALKIL